MSASDQIRSLQDRISRLESDLRRIPLRPTMGGGTGGGNNIPSVANYAALPSGLTVYCFYATEDDDCLYYWDLTQWLCISHIK